MSKAAARSMVLTIRVPRGVERRLAQEARRLRRTRSDVARTLLEAALAASPAGDPREEAHRQSALASTHNSDRDVLRFIVGTADLRGWK
jgi:predicted transcriptional regulator